MNFSHIQFLDSNGWKIKLLLKISVCWNKPCQGQYNYQGGQVDDGKKQYPDVRDYITKNIPDAFEFYVMSRECCNHENVASSKKYKR